MVLHAIWVTPERLARADATEDALRALAESIATRLSELGFRHVTLDLLGFRSGSMNEVLPASQLKIRG